MPLVRMVTNVELNDSKTQEKLLDDLSKKTAELLAKPESYMMVSLQTGATMLMGGEPGPTAFLDVRSLGEMAGATTQSLAKALTEIVRGATGVEPRRIYINFSGLPRELWAHNGNTFA